MIHEPLSARQLNAYLERIGQTTLVPADVEGLFHLHRGQFFSIPFENFDIMLGRGIDCGAEAVHQKLVVDRRGGYCFELNGLALRVLSTLGFEARPVLARVHLTGEPSGLTQKPLHTVLFREPADPGRSHQPPWRSSFGVDRLGSTIPNHSPRRVRRCCERGV